MNFNTNIVMPNNGENNKYTQKKFKKILSWPIFWIGIRQIQLYKGQIWS